TLTAAVALTAWQAKSQEPAKQDGYQRWLNEDVVYIIMSQERIAFERLQTNEERDMFIKQFWDRRNPTPGAAENPFKEEHYRRIAYANTRFATLTDIPGWKTDRGRIYIVYGPPNEIESHASGGAYKQPAEEGGNKVKTRAFEQWRYKFIKDV